MSIIARELPSDLIKSSINLEFQRDCFKFRPSRAELAREIQYLKKKYAEKL